MKAHFAVVALVTLVGSFAFAGAENVSIDCVSKSGRTKVMADVPGDNLDAYVIVSVDGKTVSFANRSLQSIGIDVNHLGQERTTALGKGAVTASIATAETNTNYALTVVDSKADTQALSLIATSPLKLKIGTYGERNGRFNAQLITRDPREANKSLQTEVNCEYDYAP